MERKVYSEYQRYGDPVWAQRSSHGPHNPFEEHKHDFIELIYIVQGRGKHTINGQHYESRPGDLFIVMPGESHHFPDTIACDLEIINCLFRREALPPCLPLVAGVLSELPYVAPFYNDMDRLPRRLTLTSVESTSVLMQLEEIIQEVHTSGTVKHVVAYLLIHLLIQLSRIYLKHAASIEEMKPAPLSNEILVRRIKTYLEQSFQQKLTTEQLAKSFTISTRHLNRIFRQQTGKSITETVQQIRIERAKQMLAETNRSINSIASFVGFNEVSHFNKLFLRFTANTPSGYRKQVRHESS